MKNSEVAANLIELLGGKENIEKVECCMTRVRAALKNSTPVEVKKIKNLEGVYGIFGKANDLQIVLGPGDAQEIVHLMEEILGN